MAIGDIFSNIVYGVKKNSPTLCFIGGVTAFVGTCILASKATLEAEDIIDEHNKRIEDIETAGKIAAAEGYSGKPYGEAEMKKDKTTAYTKTGVSLAKAYAPAIATGALSITLFLAGQKILNGRYVAAASAYSGLQKLFNDYRGRVREDLGPEKDRQFLYGSRVEKKAIEAETVDPETGKTKKEKLDAEYIDINIDDTTGNIRVWGEYNSDGSRNWQYERNHEMSLSWLRAKESFWNDILRTRKSKVVTENEVAHDIGLNMTQSGQFLGWDRNKNPDAYIDFGLGDWSDPQVKRFINNDIDSVILTFNVDGIYTTEGKLKKATPVICSLRNS